MSDNVYIHRLYKAKCDCGTMSNYLNVVKDHGTVWMAACEPGATHDDKWAFMNACDFVPKENVIHFGRCNSKANMGNHMDKEEFIMNILLPGSAILKELMGCGGCKCQPIVSDAWGNVDDTVLVNGVPILTEKSRLYCRNGGTITIEPVDTESTE